jgi:hypothetical protein
LTCTAAASAFTTTAAAAAAAAIATTAFATTATATAVAAASTFSATATATVSTAAAAAAAFTAATTVTAATTTVATAATTATTVAATAAAWGARFHGPGFIHHQASTAKGRAIHASDCCLSFSIAAHFNKTKAFGTTSVALHHDLGAGDSAELTKRLFQVAIAHGIWQIADVQFVTHSGTP